MHLQAATTEPTAAPTGVMATIKPYDDMMRKLQQIDQYIMDLVPPHAVSLVASLGMRLHQGSE